MELLCPQGAKGYFLITLPKDWTNDYITIIICAIALVLNKKLFGWIDGSE
jgi:hypothetical protein